VTRRANLTPAVLVKYDVITFNKDNILCYRKILESVLIDDTVKGGFDALEHLAAIEAEPSDQAGAAEFNWFYLSFTTGGWFPNDPDSNVDVTVHMLNNQLQQIAKLLKPIDEATGTAPGTSDNILSNVPTPAAANTKYTLPAISDKMVAWKEIYAFAFMFSVRKGSNDYLGVQEVTLDGVAADGKPSTVFSWKGDIALHDAGEGAFGWNIGLATLPTPTITPLMSLKGDERAALNKLITHLNCPDYNMYYNRAVWLNENPNTRVSRFDAINWDGASTLLDHIDNRAVENIGPWVAFPSADMELDKLIQTLVSVDQQHSAQLDPKVDERLVTLPTRGIFAEAKLGHCNASEEIDNTRFWDWQQSPIPHMAPEIAPVTAVTPQPQQPNLTPTPLPASLVNIVNPPAAPDPTGLAAALSILGTPNIFRDMSGQAAVADLLKKLSDNSISIAQTVNLARDIQAKYGNAPASGGVATGGGFGARATPIQPSAATRDLQDYRNELQQGVKDGLMSSDQARSAYANAGDRVSSGTPMLGFDISDITLDAQSLPGIITPAVSSGGFNFTIGTPGLSGPTLGYAGVYKFLPDA
jgi:hypothetical protein